MDSVEFLRPRLRGSRFDNGEIPLEVLGDLVALGEMVQEVAKWRFLKENPQRQRIPRGFTDSVNLKLTRVERGSGHARNKHCPEKARLGSDLILRQCLSLLKALPALLRSGPRSQDLSPTPSTQLTQTALGPQLSPPRERPKATYQRSILRTSTKSAILRRQV